MAQININGPGETNTNVNPGDDVHKDGDGNATLWLTGGITRTSHGMGRGRLYFLYAGQCTAANRAAAQWQRAYGGRVAAKCTAQRRAELRLGAPPAATRRRSRSS